MPDLLQSLLQYDIGHLNIIAELWGVELESKDVDSAAEELNASLLDFDSLLETLDILPPAARSALDALVAAGGKMEWILFTRNFGELRDMGAARRDREKPHLRPASGVESLYYHGLISKAFFETEKGPQEFAYIADDLLELLAEQLQDLASGPLLSAEPLGRAATPGEKAYEIPATDHVLDDATTYLASLRANQDAEFKHAPQLVLNQLLETAGLVKKNELQSEAVKVFLASSRADALNMLYHAWIRSATFDELRLIPGILCEGEWSGQPQVTREFLLSLLKDIPRNKWWSIAAFVRDIKTKFPDFQRPAGDYDSWFIKRESDGQFLRGFAYWDAVDGALIRFFFQILHWLGQIHLAAPENGKEPAAFLFPASFESRKEEKEKISVSSSGKITVSRYVSRAVRYQIARFCEWEEPKGDEYFYRVTAGSLQRAAAQSLKAEQLLSMLVKYTNNSVPPALVKALKRWDAGGTEARVETLPVLRVSRPEILEEMRKSKAAKFLGESLSPTAVVVREGAIQHVLAALAEMGLLAELKD